MITITYIIKIFLCKIENKKNWVTSIKTGKELR